MINLPLAREKSKYIFLIPEGQCSNQPPPSLHSHYHRHGLSLHFQHHHTDYPTEKHIVSRILSSVLILKAGEGLMLQTKERSPSCSLAKLRMKRVLVISLGSNPKRNVGTRTSLSTTVSGHFHAQSVLNEHG